MFVLCAMLFVLGVGYPLFLVLFYAFSKRFLDYKGSFRHFFQWFNG